jgi:hypothetical protein
VTVRVQQDADTLRAMLERGQRDSELLDGRDFNEQPWDDAHAALSRLVAAAETTEQELCACGHAKDVHRHSDMGRVCQHADKKCLCGAFRAAAETTPDDGERE